MSKNKAVTIKKLILLLTLMSTLISCDPVYHSEIKNETQTEIIIQIQFDRDALGYEYYTPFLNDFPGFGDVAPPIAIDTVNLVSTYKIASGDRLPLHSKIAKRPDYTIFKEILILKPDSIHLRNPEEIRDAFVETETRYWELIIK